MSALATTLDFKQLTREIYEHGMTNLPNILPVQWADELDEDVGLQFIDALKQHMSCEIVADTTANLPSLKTPHSIEGLVMGKAPM